MISIINGKLIKTINLPIYAHLQGGGKKLNVVDKKKNPCQEADFENVSDSGQGKKTIMFMM